MTRSARGPGGAPSLFHLMKTNRACLPRNISGPSVGRPDRMPRDGLANLMSKETMERGIQIVDLRRAADGRAERRLGSQTLVTTAQSLQTRPWFRSGCVDRPRGSKRPGRASASQISLR